MGESGTTIPEGLTILQKHGQVLDMGAIIVVAEQVLQLSIMTADVLERLIHRSHVTDV